MTYNPLHEIQKVAPVVVVIALIFMFVTTFFHPILVLLVFLIFTTLIFHTIDKNTSVLEGRIKRLEYKLRTLELKGE